MKKKVIVFVFSISILAISGFSVIRSGGDVVNHTGSPADGSADCTGCHSGGATPSVVSVTASPSFGPGNTYTPGATYTLSLTVSGYPYFGFDLEMLDGQLSTSVDAGTIVSAVSSCKITKVDPFPTNLTHTGPLSSGTQAQWTWTAPVSGPVYIYAAGLGVNLDAKTSGDRIADFSMTLTPLITGMKDNVEQNANLNLFPNPASHSFHLNYTLDKISSVKIDLFDLSGNHIRCFLNKIQEAGENTYESDIISDLPKGIYLLDLNIDGKSSGMRLVIR